MVLTCSPVKKAFPAGCSKRPSSKAAGGARTGSVAFLTRPPPSCQDSSFPLVGYVEDSCELRTKRGTRRVLARQGWAGEKSGFFNSLLCREELFGIGRRKATKLSAVAGAIQDRHLQTLQ